MAQTIAFITPAQFLQVYDERRVCQLCSDTGTAITAAAILTNTTLWNALARGAGMIAAACRVGQRYSYADLMALCGNITTVVTVQAPIATLQVDAVTLQLREAGLLASDDFQPSTYQLRQLNADLSFGLLNARRGLSGEELNAQAPMWQFSLGQLEELRLGERIFDLGGAPDAGLPGRAVLGINTDTAGTSIGSQQRIWGSAANRGSWWNQ